MRKQIPVGVLRCAAIGLTLLASTAAFGGDETRATIDAAFGAASVPSYGTGLMLRSQIGLLWAERKWDEDRSSQLANVLFGIEAWRISDETEGLGLPLTFYYGYRTPVLTCAGGVGVETWFRDHYNHRGGPGLLAPLLAGQLGFDTGWLRVLGDVRGVYRWRAEGADHLQLQTTFVLEIPLFDYAIALLLSSHHHPHNHHHHRR